MKKIKLIKQIDNTSVWGYEETITIYVDGDSAGYIAIEEIMEGEACIECIEIFEPYRGKGFFNMLLIAAFSMFDIIDLHSDNRDEHINSICRHWTRNPALDSKDNVTILMDEGKFLLNN
tara:strand:+ start:606 stop:962 length:357 start_codon:yes stop_codon:yes gene_type:complete